jgi:hypothetical protein
LSLGVYFFFAFKEKCLSHNHHKYHRELAWLLGLQILQ